MALDRRPMPELRRHWGELPDCFQAAWEAWLLGDTPAQCEFDEPPNSPVSAVNYARNYRYALEWAELEEEIDGASMMPSAIWTPNRIARLSADLHRGGSASASARAILIGIERMLCAISPDVDRAFVKREIKKIPRGRILRTRNRDSSIHETSWSSAEKPRN